jgi:DNA repair photolyase
MLKIEYKKFNPLNVSSKFAICGLPIRLDSYKNCSFNCKYCFSNYRKVMEFDKELQIGNVKSVEKKLKDIFVLGKVKEGDFLDVAIKDKITLHCGGMSDPFQPVEEKLNITKQIVDETNKYNMSILFSTKADTVYNTNINPNLHTFQLSVTNLTNNRLLEPNVPDIHNRIKFYNDLKRDGFKVGIRIQPFIPNITESEIIDIFHDADHITIEGLKLVPQNKEHKEYLLDLLKLKKEDFTQMGLLNLKPEIRLKLYEPFISKLKKYNLSYSISDNDLHYLSTSNCCCGDALIHKSSCFNNTYLLKNYGLDYKIEDVKDNLGDYANCKVNHLFTSNRQEGCKTVEEFYEKRFDRKSSPFSPKFLYIGNK